MSEEKTKVYLMNREYPVLELLFREDKLESIGKPIDEKRLPMALRYRKLTVSVVQKWIDDRPMPTKKGRAREGYDDAVKRFGNFMNDKNLFSLADHYWLQWSKNERFAELNYFTRDYGSDIGRIFFSPYSIEPANSYARSPDLTTGGLLKKTWIIDEKTKKRQLVKQGSQKLHQEPLNEVLGSSIAAEISKLEVVPYKFYILGNAVCSICDNFVGKNTEYFAAQDIYTMDFEPIPNATPIEQFLSNCEHLKIKNVLEYVKEIIIVDYILMNSDRNFKNFGFLRDSLTGRILGPAPLFDFGKSFVKAKEKQNTTEIIFGKDFINEVVAEAKSDGRLQNFTYNSKYRSVITQYPLISNSTKNDILGMMMSKERELNQEKNISLPQR